jgi:hypothetical protein
MGIIPTYCIIISIKIQILSTKNTIFICKYKTWITGSAGGGNNSDLDAMEVQFLSERALCTLGANNFFIFEA